MSMTTGSNGTTAATAPPPQIDYATALQRLEQGNRRFTSDVRSVASLGTTAQRAAVASAQHPFAAILSCSDSRVPSEMVFDQGLGSLFVIRVAGNIVAPSLVGSIEYAVESFGLELVVVMGHTSCGAIKATFDHLNDSPVESENVLAIVDAIRPVMAPLVATCGGDKETLLAKAARANVAASAQQLRTRSPLLRDRIKAGRLLVVGAEYSLETGVVDMFEGVPPELRARFGHDSIVPAAAH